MGELEMRVGISSCLLGNEVRFDGGHKLDHYLHDTLGAFVEWVPVCPELEYGLPVPREALRLVGDPAAPRLVTSRTGVDHTDGMKAWAAQRLDGLEQEDLCGFVFKSRSPSSGMRQVKVYPAEGGAPSHTGVGIFARAFMERFPRHGQPVLDLRADGDPLDEGAEGVAQVAVQLVPAVEADRVAEQAGTDADADRALVHGVPRCTLAHFARRH